MRQYLYLSIYPPVFIFAHGCAALPEKPDGSTAVHSLAAQGCALQADCGMPGFVSEMSATRQS